MVSISILLYLNWFQTYREDTIHRLETDRQSVRLLRSVIEAYRVDGGNDWRFCLLAGSVLSDISMNNISKGNSFSELK